MRFRERVTQEYPEVEYTRSNPADIILSLNILTQCIFSLYFYHDAIPHFIFALLFFWSGLVHFLLQGTKRIISFSRSITDLHHSVPRHFSLVSYPMDTIEIFP